MTENLVERLRQFADHLGDGDQFDNIKGEAMDAAADRIEELETVIERWCEFFDD